MSDATICRFPLLACIALSMMVTSGCTSIIGQLDSAAGLSRVNISYLVAANSCVDRGGKNALEDRFAKSFEQPEATSPKIKQRVSTTLQGDLHALRAASVVDRMLSSETEVGRLVRANILAKWQTGLPSEYERASFPTQISRSRLSQEINESLEIAQMGGFGRYAAARLTADKAEAQFPSNEAVLAVFLQNYLTAYFRRGKFFDFKVDAAAASARLEKDFRNAYHVGDRKLTADETKAIDDAAKAFVKAICTNKPDCTLLDYSDEDAAFFDRAGSPFKFPTISIVFAPGQKTVPEQMSKITEGVQITRIDEIEVAGSLTRVFWEAVFDSLVAANNIKRNTGWLVIPASSKANVCSATTELWAPVKPPYQPCIVADDKVAQDRFTKINFAADTTEALAGYVAAQLVRGGWILSLNNEALARILETSISVSARKTAEIVAAVDTACTHGNSRALASVDLGP